jgi:hypothetical protein
MTEDLQALESLLLEICDVGAVAEDKGINRIPPLDPLLEKARSLGIEVPAPATLDELRTAVENACEAARAGSNGVRPDNLVAAAHILGNKNGIPGDGP